MPISLSIQTPRVDLLFFGCLYLYLYLYGSYTLLIRAPLGGSQLSEASCRLERRASPPKERQGRGRTAGALIWYIVYDIEYRVCGIWYIV